MKVSLLKCVLMASGFAAAVLASPTWAQGPAAPAAPAASATPAEGPSPECLKVLDTLASSIPKEESLVELKRKGVRLQSPLLPTGVNSPATSSGAVVRMKIEYDGKPVPGSVSVTKTQGDAAVARAVEAAVGNMMFDLSEAKSIKYPFTFSTAYVSCARP